MRHTDDPGTDPVRQAIVDVISLRGLARAIRILMSPPRAQFDHALTRTLAQINATAAEVLRRSRTPRSGR